MADSAGPAQSPSTCQFCEESVEIKLFCVHCELFLCLVCNRKIHSKSKTCQGHKVIQLKDLGTGEVADTRRHVDLENLTCEGHKGQKCVEFCMECNEAICLKCSYESHQKHSRSDLEEFYGVKLTEVKKFKGDCDENISVLDNELQKLSKINIDKTEEYKKVKDDISKREADIMAKVKKHSQKLHEEVDKVYQPVLTEIKNNISEVEREKNQLNEKTETMDSILNSHQAGDVLKSSQTMDDVSVTQQSSDLPTLRCVFGPGPALDSKVREIFGDVYKIPELKLVNTYQTELDGVRNIIHRNKDEKIISSYCSNKLQRVRFDNDTMTVIKEEDIQVYDMALMENGDVVISGGVSELMIYTKEGTIKPYKSFDPLGTLGVHVNKNNEVLVGLTESGSITVTPDSIRKVVVLNQSGDIQHTYQYTRDKQRRFTLPYRIITCQDTICVVDILNSSREGRVVALDYGGQVQWVYNGEGNEGKDKFYPRSMAVTSTDLILVADDENHSIHVLNSGGEVMVCHQVKDLGVEKPFSLCLDNDGLLWVGCFKKVCILQGIE